MVESKAWDWERVEENAWLEPCEESYYLAEQWKNEGVRSVLDLGCGRGRHSVFFAKKGFKVTAADLSKEAINYAIEWRKRERVDFLCKRADMMRLPFSDDAFDAVFSYHVISHTDTEGIWKILAEITRVLKPEGKVFLTLCSKEHYAYKDESNRKIDANTVFKTEGAETDVPHFFADEELIFQLFENYEIRGLRHICECGREEALTRHKCHYYIEAVVKKEAAKLDYSAIIGQTVKCTIDRPLGTTHPRHPDIYYPINYGYVDGVFAGDGAEQDVYVIGENEPLRTFTGVVIGVYHRFNDNEDKWIVVAEGARYTEQEILEQIEFQEKFFDGVLVLTHGDGDHTGGGMI